MQVRRVAAAMPAALLICAFVLGVDVSHAATRRTATVSHFADGVSAPLHLHSRWLVVTGMARGVTAPPSDVSCRSTFGIPCYSPQEIRRAYGVDALLSRGGDGAGETIVIIDSFGSPTIQADLAAFDQGYGLPAPPSFQVLSPLGTVPFDPAVVPDQISWAFETTLDVEWAHALAPAANIILLTSPVDETEGVQGMPEFDQLLNYALDHHLGQVVSQSWGVTENTLFTPPGNQVFARFESSYARAAQMGVTALASAGDFGSSNPNAALTSFYPFPTVNFPASSPLVTAVGGTSLSADTGGNYQSETVWNDGAGAGGGGTSQTFSESAYQAALPVSAQEQLRGARGGPDVSWNADPGTPVLVYISIFGADAAGFYGIGGTSEGAPAWAGVVADIDQLVGRPIGLLNPYLYALGSIGKGYHDVISGNNSFNGVSGYAAAPGWDLASGWGSPSAGDLGAGIESLLSRIQGLGVLASEKSHAARLHLRNAP